MKDIGLVLNLLLKIIEFVIKLVYGNYVTKNKVSINNSVKNLNSN